jgi:hypothetical protein
MYGKKAKAKLIFGDGTSELAPLRPSDLMNDAQCAGCGARLRDERGNCAYCGSGRMPVADVRLIWNPELVKQDTSASLLRVDVPSGMKLSDIIGYV